MAKLPAALAADFNISKPHVSDVLDKKLAGADYLGGPSIRGWSKIKSYMVCDRLYYLNSIKKMRPVKQSPALDIGTLLHACLAAHYSSGGVLTFEPLKAVWDEIPDVAQEVSRLLSAYFQMYAVQEAAEWDIRAIEHEVIGTMKAKLPGLPQEHAAPVSCRFDLVVRKKTANDDPHPYGPCPDGVYVVDHKTHRAITRDLTEGYAMDGQFLLMAYLWKNQNLDAVFGKLNGFIINIITKTNLVECKRLDVGISDEDVARFAKAIAPVAVEMDIRAKLEEAQDPENWPMNFAVCKSPYGYGLCSFWDWCISHGKQEGLYQIAAWNPQPSAK